jgi:GT2 family glycosyltransferase
MIDIISATRLSKEDFWTKSALGLSLQRLRYNTEFTAYVSTENRRGLPGIFNERIHAADCREHLVFIHDDVWIDDYFFSDRVIAGLDVFDVIGVAGNRRRLPGQPSWASSGFDAATRELLWDSKSNLSGRIAHGSGPFGAISAFGPVPAECELLDGVFLATRKSKLAAAGVFFDPRFSFHFYDMDFCRAARDAKLRLGTWPICLTHQSTGNFRDEMWMESYLRYQKKWRE